VSPVRLEELDTPAVVIDEAVLADNLQRMQDLADARGVRLRPHIKTHKSVGIARRQLERGAVGITVATLSEAEIMATHGIDDIFLAYPIVGRPKVKRLAALLSATRGTLRWRFTVDSLTAGQWLEEAASLAGVSVDTVIEVDTGMRRCGVSGPEQAVSLARALTSLPHVHLVGVMTHAGHAHDILDPAVVEAVGLSETRQLVTIAEELRRDGHDISVVSAGSTLTAAAASSLPGLTEIRPGTYVFNDLRTQEIGSCRREHIAATVLATVVSRPEAERLVIDAGSKTLTPTSVPTFGFGRALDYSDLEVVRLSEEHGVCRVAADNPLRVGDRVRILPIHICVVMNMQREVYLVREGVVVDTVPVEACIASQ
jgi:D-serine deaminase-like pyridoxal phosphate-dependent protein